MSYEYPLLIWVNIAIDLIIPTFSAESWVLIGHKNPQNDVCTYL